jgi:hypothetical protein
VRILIVPHANEANPQPTLELRRRVRDFLGARCLPYVARNVRVNGPVYVAVGVLAHVSLSDRERIAAIESELRASLNRWLHPLTGGEQGQGWPFGASVCAAHIAGLIESTPGVDYATRVALRRDGANAGDTVTVGPDMLPCAGAHEIVLSLSTS